MNTTNYVIKSLELHMFFGRIMKEHSFFLKAGFTPAAASFSNKAEHFMKEFEKLLCQAVTLSNGLVRTDVSTSGEIVTEFTAEAERQTEHFTGIPINKILTQRELRLVNGERSCRLSTENWSQVCRLNRTVLKLLDGLIAFKENVLHNVLNCEIFTVNYPLLIEHIIREARLYREYVSALERDGDITDESMKNAECFWNRIMMEHAMFIRGLLDPTETELMNTADSFAKDYSALLENCKNAQNRAMKSESLEETLKFREFKKAGVKGITGCKIRSLILPLLADHILREANHYIRLLKC